MVFAFEPSIETLEYLKMTRDMNPNIEIIENGLGNTPGDYSIIIDPINSGRNKIINYDTDYLNKQPVKITTLDKFIQDKKIDKVDFIKADIEGYERNMLLGAKETLRKFGPKLAICTYHYPNDPEVLKDIILTSNSKYIIIQKKHKLYAMVKNNTNH